MLASRPTLPTVALEPHHVDILALALIAVGVFLGGVSYLDWAGGALGDGAVRAARFVFGALGYAVPVALVIAGLLILMREWRPPTRPLRTGLGCLVAALTLMLAAGTLGIGPGATPAAQFWHAAAFERRGGIVGQAEFWVISHLLSTLGADILAVFLFVAGLILVSGATLATVVRATGAGVVGTGRAVRRSTDGFSSTLGGRRPATAAAATRSRARSVTVTGDADGPITADRLLDPTSSIPSSCPSHCCPPSRTRAELIVRATHVEAPPNDARAADDSDDPAPPLFDPDGAGGEGEIEASDERAEPEPTRLGPLAQTSIPRISRRRGATARPSPTTPTSSGRSRTALSRPLHRRGGQARHRRAGAGGPHAAGDPRPLRDRRQGHRARHRPAHHAL